MASRLAPTVTPDTAFFWDGLKEHTLLQAIARVNRTAENKNYGLVVDYWGVSEALQEAQPQVAPRRVAVHTHDGADRAVGPPFEQMPTMDTAVVGRHVDRARPRRVDAPLLPLLGTRTCRSAHAGIALMTGSAVARSPRAHRPLTRRSR